MSYQYPSGDEIQLAEDQIDDVMNEPVLRAVSEAYRLEAQKREQAGSAVDTSDTNPDEHDFTDADQGTYGEGDDAPEQYKGGSSGDVDEELQGHEFGDIGDFDDDDELPAPVITSIEEQTRDTPPQSTKSNLMPESFDPKKGYNKEYRRNDYSYTDRDWTFEDPYDPVDMKDFDRMFVCRTNEYDPETGRQKLIEANPNDPKHLLEAMEMAGDIMDSNRVKGLAKKFESANTTTAISMTFAHEAMSSVYKDNGLHFETMSNPSSSRVSIKNGNLNSKTPHSYSYSVNDKYDGRFHKLFQDNFLMQMNHRLTQEAIERNREYFPNGIPLGSHDKEGFTFDKFKSIGLQCATDAYSRTKIQLDLIKKHEIAIEKNKAFAEQFKKDMAPKIKNENMIEGFGREFKVHKGETHAEAVKRMRLEFKEHGKKFCNDLEGRGIDVILAQGLAKSRGSDQVSDAHIREANDIWKEMRNNPLKYNSTERMIREVTGSNPDLHKSLMHNLDGRSTFQRSYHTMQRYGEHLHCYADGRTRIRDEDRQAAKAFAASTLMSSDDEGLATRLRKTIEHNGYSPEQAISGRNRMLESVGKLNAKDGQAVTREEIRQPLLEKATNKAAREMAAKQNASPPPAPTGDDQGPEPGGPSKGKGKGRSM